MNVIKSILDTKKQNSAYKYVNKCVNKAVLNIFNTIKSCKELESEELGLYNISTIKIGNNLYKVIIIASYNPINIKGLTIKFQVILLAKNISAKENLYHVSPVIFDQSSNKLTEDIINYLKGSIDSFNMYFNSIYIKK